MKITGIILLLIGILSFIGGLVSPSDSHPGVEIMGYILKFAFITGGIALIVKGQKSFINKINKSYKNAPQRSNSHENTENKKTDEYSLPLEKKKKPDEHSSILGKKKILSDLKRDNVLTDNEFNEKLALLEEQEQEIIRQQKKKQIDSLVETRIKPFVSKLDELLKASILSKDEFETKKKQLYKKYYEKIVKEMPHINPNYSYQIETISKYSLKPSKRRMVTELEQRLQKGEAILMDKKTMYKYYIYTLDNFNKLLNSNNCQKYIYVDLHV